MSNQNNGGPAFPTVEQFNNNGSIAVYADSGMSIRDYFAAKAMAAIQATPEHVLESDGSDGPSPLTDADIARLAYQMADAMLKERDK